MFTPSPHFPHRPTSSHYTKAKGCDSQLSRDLRSHFVARTLPASEYQDGLICCQHEILKANEGYSMKKAQFYSNLASRLLHCTVKELTEKNLTAAVQQSDFAIA